MKRPLLFALAAFLASFALPLSALEIYRPENAGSLNAIPCLFRITDESGADASARIRHISYNWYYELPRPAFSSQPKKLHKYFNGCFSGGAVVHLIMEPGVYRISVYTPASLQQGYHDEHAELHRVSAEPFEWTSDEFVYDSRAPFPAGKPRVIWVSPCADDNCFFNGRWHIGAKSPAFYQSTKPRMEAQ